nr:hypothetical protein [candidate division Zixibacteria bacterium]
MKRMGFSCAVSACLILIIAGCIQKVERPAAIEPGRYFPLHVGDDYYYSGPVGHFAVVDAIGDLRTVAYFDSSGVITHREDYVKSDSRIGLKSMMYRVPGHAYIGFEPALPFVPWSNLIGDTLLFSSTEIRGDSNFTHLRIMVEYKITAIETLVTMAGTFEDCIKIGMTYRTLENGVGNKLDGQSTWWFTRDVGFVRYETPEGVGELLRADVDGRSYP